MVQDIPPLSFAPVFKEKIWGGRELVTVFHKNIPAGRSIGESWEISGVMGDESICTTTPFSGRTLNAIATQEGHALLGRAAGAVDEFPLLFKFIDAQDKLSVQVHPDDAQARTGGWGDRGKTECWYVVKARPGARLICGVNPGVSAADIRQGVKTDTLQDYLNFIDIAAGDVVFVPAGTIHAIDAGILLYEVQQTSDITFRLYDWGRIGEDGAPRALHIEQALASLRLEAHGHHKIQAVPLEADKGIIRRLRVACSYFALEEYEFVKTAEFSPTPRNSFAVCTLMRGAAYILDKHGTRKEYRAGDSCLLAAQGLSKISFQAQAGALMLVSWAPDLAQDIVAPLRAAGIAPTVIAQLGGNPLQSALAPYL
ncbi:MAG: class I mannose-6-phosphate isomerase [Chitinivibrionales bacterium]|nr:class I mannose-6-phosphate isomerase [Chitinivibrionales bacterium]